MENIFYDIKADEEDLVDILDPETRGNCLFAVLKEEEIIGFFSVSNAAANFYDVDLGMIPDLTGDDSSI
ncbi:hypothetical protein FZC76_03880 [Sutcliffiella horikoshii]|uniref:Uncharacterized protein n=1 Tax=Sutcliffiella horikoshii TaxID=79883 RepID=A0A5D4T953_9BACI|nr:hypothetical protein [Sutcliffiella horikoshii]TYS71042.1 hypothetical protein FZC76_03880 [Sutcliffiella horikoshii]